MQKLIQVITFSMALVLQQQAYCICIIVCLYYTLVVVSAFLCILWCHCNILSYVWLSRSFNSFLLLCLWSFNSCDVVIISPPLPPTLYVALYNLNHVGLVKFNFTSYYVSRISIEVCDCFLTQTILQTSETSKLSTADHWNSVNVCVYIYITFLNKGHLCYVHALCGGSLWDKMFVVTRVAFFPTVLWNNRKLLIKFFRLVRIWHGPMVDETLICEKIVGKCYVGVVKGLKCVVAMRLLGNLGWGLVVQYFILHLWCPDDYIE
jgi:hypothetical protein